MQHSRPHFSPHDQPHGHPQAPQPRTSTGGASRGDGPRSRAGPRLQAGPVAGRGLPPLFPGRAALVLLPLSDFSRSQPLHRPSSGRRVETPPFYNMMDSGPPAGGDPHVSPYMHDLAAPAYYARRPAAAGGRGEVDVQPAWDLILLASAAAEAPAASLLLETPEQDDVPYQALLGDSQANRVPVSHSRAQSGDVRRVTCSRTLPERDTPPLPGDPASGPRRLGLVTPVLQKCLAAISTASGSRGKGGEAS